MIIDRSNIIHKIVYYMLTIIVAKRVKTKRKSKGFWKIRGSYLFYFCDEGWLY